MGAWFPHGELNPDLSLERAASLPLDYVGMHGVGFEPTRFTTPGLKSGSLDHSDNRAYEHFKACSALVLPGGLEPPTSA